MKVRELMALLTTMDQDAVVAVGAVDDCADIDSVRAYDLEVVEHFDPSLGHKAYMVAPDEEDRAAYETGEVVPGVIISTEY